MACPATFGHQPKKKSFGHLKADEGERGAFQLRMAAHEKAGRVCVYLDESGFAADMPRMHGYAPKGKRCAGRRNWRERGRTNALGASIGHVFASVCLFGCNINGEIFFEWLRSDLLPELVPGSVIVLDNASFHKRDDVVELMEGGGFTVEFLPAYSPDLNPIEKKWAQAKAYRRKFGCSVEDIFKNGNM